MACTLTLQTGSSPPVAGDKSWEEMNTLSSIKMPSCSLLSSWAACRPAACQLLTLLEGPYPCACSQGPQPSAARVHPSGTQLSRAGVPNWTKGAMQTLPQIYEMGAHGVLWTAEF